MATKRRMQFVYSTVAWLLATAFVLTLLDSLSYELFFVCGLIGLLVVIELTAPLSVSPTWRRRLRWLIALGLLGFAAVVARRIVEILPPEVLPW